jgi:hypothetical protein
MTAPRPDAPLFPGATWLIPRISRQHLLTMGLAALIGALVAGGYGIVHDEITYTISPEYFTRVKFKQFAIADFGLPRRIFVGEIGFLATWWVGFIAVWFQARLALPAWPRELALRRVRRGVALVFACALVGALVGCALGCAERPASLALAFRSYGDEIGVKDLRHFVVVAFIHYGSYGGGLIGLFGSLLRLRWLRARR